MPLPDHVLVHSAVPVTFTEPHDLSGVWEPLASWVPRVRWEPVGDEWIEGERGAQGVVAWEGQPFACVLFLPSPGGEEANPYRPRAVRSPTLMYNPARDDDSVVVVGREDEVMITAPELAAWTGGETARWQAAGVAQPFGPPGSVFGIIQTVRQVLD